MKRTSPIFAAICAAAVCAAVFCSCSDSGKEPPARPARTTGEARTITRPQTVTEATEAQTSAAVSEEAVSGVTAAQAETADFSCADITAEILASVSMSSMAEVGSDRVAMYIDCEIPEGTDFSFFICGSGGFADEVCVINTSGMDAQSFTDAVDRRIQSRMNDFEDYNPDEYDKLSDMFTKQTGDYFIYTVTGDNGECERIFDEFMNR